MRVFHTVLAGCAIAVAAAHAGPPFASDDPETTEYGHYEIYLFTSGVKARDGISGAHGIDFNYGATPDLQLTAVLPVEYERPETGPNLSGVANIELAAKARFPHRESTGWDIAVFPRVFLPSASSAIGERHASFLLPIWLEKDWNHWSTFGGGGCTLSRGGGSQDFCTVGWALTDQILPDIQLGVELVHSTATHKGEHPSTGIGVGLRYDMTENYHLLASAGPGLQNAAETGQYSWYASLLLTF